MAPARQPFSLLLLALVLAILAATPAADAFVGRPPHHAHSTSTSTTARRRCPTISHAHAPAKHTHSLPSIITLTRGGAAGGGPSTGRTSTRAALAGLAQQLVTKHFLVAGMVVSILLAARDPTIGRIGGPLRPEFTVNVIGVSLIFLLSGLSLRVDQLASAAKNLKLNAAIQGFNLGVGPLIGLAFQWLLRLAKVDARLATGLLIVSCLPTTVNMCIVLSSAARASLATAVFGAVLSNFLGTFIAPATIFWSVGAAAVNVPYLDVVRKLVYKVLVPVLLGVGLRARVPPLRRLLESPQAKLPLKLATESILISIIYTTFCQSFLTGLAVTGRDLVALALSVPAFHVVSLSLMFALARWVTPNNRGEQVAAAFTGSQKTLAFGMPLIKTIFEASPSVAHYAAPLLFIHPSQLVIGSLLVPAFARYIEQGEKDGRAGSAAPA